MQCACPVACPPTTGQAAGQCRRHHAGHTAASAYGLMSGFNVVGVLAVGALSDRWGRKHSLGGVYALRGCAFAALRPGTWSLWDFVVIMGFSWWAALLLTSSLRAEVYGLHHLGIL